MFNSELLHTISAQLGALDKRLEAQQTFIDALMKQNKELLDRIMAKDFRELQTYKTDFYASERIGLTSREAPDPGEEFIGMAVTDDERDR